MCCRPIAGLSNPVPGELRSYKFMPQAQLNLIISWLIRQIGLVTTGVEVKTYSKVALQEQGWRALAYSLSMHAPSEQGDTTILCSLRNISLASFSGWGVATAPTPTRKKKELGNISLAIFFWLGQGQ